MLCAMRIYKGKGADEPPTQTGEIEMTKTEIKQTAQDYLLQGLANAISMETNDADDPAVLEAMRGQARRVLKMFGYDSFPGIG